MNKTVICLLMLCLLSFAGCATGSGNQSNAYSQFEKYRIGSNQNQDAFDHKENPDSIQKVTENESDPITEAYEEGRYLDVIQLYESTLYDPSGVITDTMREMYYSSFDKYVESVDAKAKLAFGNNSDFEAALNVLKGGIDHASSYPSIVEPLQKIIIEYMTAQYANLIDEAYMKEDYLQIPVLYDEACLAGVYPTATMTEQYNSCFDRFIARESKKAEELIGADHNYDAAIQSLYNSMEQGQNYEYIINELDNKIYEYLTQKYAFLVEQAYQANDYLSVARVYEEGTLYYSVIATDTMQKQYESSISRYIDGVASGARQAFGSNKNYDAAMTLIHSALSESNDIETIKTQLEIMLQEYEEYIPVSLLTTLKYTKKTSNIELGSSYTDKELTKDVSNTQHDYNTILYLQDPYVIGSPDREGYIEYNLNYQYEKLTGTLYRPYQTLSCGSEWSLPGGVRIFGDNQLLYESPSITQATFESYPISINVSGIRLLKIELYGVWGVSVAYGVYDYTSKVCLGNLMIQK